MANIRDEILFRQLLTGKSHREIEKDLGGPVTSNDLRRIYRRHAVRNRIELMARYVNPDSPQHAPPKNKRPPAPGLPTWLAQGGPLPVRLRFSLFLHDPDILEDQGPRTDIHLKALLSLSNHGEEVRDLRLDHWSQEETDTYQELLTHGRFLHPNSVEARNVQADLSHPGDRLGILRDALTQTQLISSAIATELQEPDTLLRRINTHPARARLLQKLAQGKPKISRTHDFELLAQLVAPQRLPQRRRNRLRPVCLAMLLQPEDQEKFVAFAPAVADFFANPTDSDLIDRLPELSQKFGGEKYFCIEIAKAIAYNPVKDARLVAFATTK